MTFTARKLRIYRKTLAADTFAGLGATEKLEFNASGTDNKVANGWTTGIHKGTPRAIAQHPNPNENLGEQQDTGLDEDVYTIEGSISRPDLVANPFIDNLETWNEGAQENQIQLPFGRFSIELDKAPRLNKISSQVDGLEIRSLDWDLDGDIANEITFILVLSRGQEVP